MKFTENHTITGAEARVLYFKELQEGKVKQQYGWAGILSRTETIRGKQVKYTVFDDAFIYYGILDFPEGRFYGLFTTGFNTLIDAVQKNISDLHPAGDIRILEGKLVTPDGNRVEIAGITPDKLNNAAKKPAGTYHFHNALNFDDIDLTFYAGGTGRLLFKRSSRHQAVQYWAGSETRRKSNGQKEKIRKLTGGYHFFVIANIPINFKWELNEEGNINIIFTGKPVINVKCEVDGETEFANMTITESDKRIQRQVHRKDIVTNEDALQVKSMEENSIKKMFADWKGFLIPVHYIGKDRIIAKYVSDENDKQFRVLQTKKFDNTDIWYDKEMRKVSSHTSKFASIRDYGILKIFPKIKKNLIKEFKTNSPTPLDVATEYSVHYLSPDGKSGKITFISGDKIFDSNFTLDKNGHLSHESILASLVEDTTLHRINTQIETDNDEILAYKKDKRRAKIVKEYEKRIKKILPINTAYTTFSQYEAIRGKQDEVTQIQTLFLEKLR